MAITGVPRVGMCASVQYFSDTCASPVPAASRLVMLQLARPCLFPLFMLSHLLGWHRLRRLLQDETVHYTLWQFLYSIMYLFNFHNVQLI